MLTKCDHERNSYCSENCCSVLSLKPLLIYWNYFFPKTMGPKKYQITQFLISKLLFQLQENLSSDLSLCELLPGMAAPLCTLKEQCSVLQRGAAPALNILCGLSDGLRRKRSLNHSRDFRQVRPLNLFQRMKSYLAQIISTYIFFRNYLVC